MNYYQKRIFNGSEVLTSTANKTELFVNSSAATLLLITLAMSCPKFSPELTTICLLFT